MCKELITELAVASEDPAQVYGKDDGGSVDVRVRKAMRVTPSAETVDRVRQRLAEARDEIAEHFGRVLSGCEEPQFLRYRKGDFFVAHQDGNTALLRSEREQWRKVSISVFLNSQSELPGPGTYAGGALVFSEWRPDRPRGEFRLAGEEGTLVAFPSETTHEVIPVTRGERYAVVSWYG
jgi:SM-20-related protein